MPIFPALEKAEASTGDFAIFRESTGTETVDSTGVPYDHTWDTTEQSNSNITLQGNNSDIDLADGGKYLVMYTAWAEQGTSTAGSNRRSIGTYLTLNGSQTAYGRGNGYIRDSEGDFTAYAASGAIIDASAGDDLQLHIQRTDTNTGAGTNIPPGTNGINIIKLKDSWDYLRIRKAATSSSISGNTSFTDVTFDTADEVDTDSFAFTPTSGSITLKGAAGSHFLVTTNVGLLKNTTGSTRQNYEMQLTLDGTEIDGSRVTTYIRAADGTDSGGLVYTGIITKTSASDQILNVEVRRESSGSASTVIRGDRTALSVAKLPDTAEYVMLTDQSGTQALTSSRVAMNFDTNNEVDTSAFDHSTSINPSRVDINKAGNYLFFSTVYDQTTTSGNNRQPHRIDWQKSASVMPYGAHGGFNRANQTFSAGSSGGLVLSGLTTSDFVEIAHIDETSSAPVDATFQAGRVAMQGVVLNDNFFGTDVLVGATGSHVTEVGVPVTSQYQGGSFAIQELSSSRNITSVTLTESGTVDGQNGLANIALYYELDTSAPYDCSSESYDGGESLFGSIDTNGFSGADGVSSFSGSVSITTTQTFCGYVVYDITNSASDGETIDINIATPNTNVVVSGGGSVGPLTEVGPSGSTLISNFDFTQIHYHWRNDDGTESGATSASGGAEDTPLAAISLGAAKRLRMEISHEGSRSLVSEVGVVDAFATGNTRSISSGSDRLFLVGIYSEDSATNVNVNTVSYGGQVLTEVRDAQVTTVASNGVWVGYLTESQIQAASGNTISPTWVGGTPDTSVMYSSVVLENVDQSNPVSGWSSNTATAASSVQATSSLATTDGDMNLYFTVSGETANAHTQAGGYTEGTEQDDGNAMAANALKTITSSGTEQPTATWSGTNNRLAIVDLNVKFKAQREGLLQYKLQYGIKTSACSDISTWTDVAEVGGHWDTSISPNLTFGADTSNISEATGGVTNEGTTFVGTSGVLNGGDKSLSTRLGIGEYAEFEYTVVPTSNAIEGNTYCFRTVDGTPDVTHSYRIPLTIQSSQVDSTVANFPVYVNLTDLGSHFFSNVASDGSDIRVTESDGLTEIAREVVSISVGGKTGEVYFKAPSISSTADTTFYIYYGGANSGEYQASSTYGLNSVWDDGYEAVYHFEEDPSGSAPQYNDSTGNSFGTSVNMEGADSVAGIVGNAASIDGVDEHIETTLNAGSLTNSTWSLFLNANGTQGGCDGPMFSRGTDVSGMNVGACGDTSLVGYHWNDAAASYNWVGGPTYPTNAWYLSTMVIEPSQSTVYAHTNSGVTSGSNVVSHAASTIDNLDFGWDSFGDARSFSGIIDEARLSSVARSAEWLSAVYDNIATPNVFYATSTVETLTQSPVDVLYDVYPEATINADVAVSATGTQATSVDEGSTDNYLGGAFVIQANTGTPNVTSITITENGTVNASTSLENIRLLYDLDTSGADGFDCSSESYSGGESQFGSIDTDGFSSANGTSTFTGSVGISTTQSMCVYVVFDVNTNASDGETVDIEINLPNSEVVVSSGSVAPGTAVAISGSTNIAGQILTQTRYHWRNDDGAEAGASSATGGSEDVALIDVPKGATQRLRMQISNEGSVTSSATQYRIEYGTKITTCDAIASWQDVDVGTSFAMGSTSQLVEGNNTTDIATTTGGLTNPGGNTFLSTNGGQKKDTSQTGNITLTSTQFVELEYAIVPTADSGYDTTYCFRLTDAGAQLDAYSSYAELTTREKQDYFIQRGVSTISGTSLTLTAGADYTAPTASTSAFIRITNTQMTGAGNNTGGGNQNADDVTVYISNPENIETSITLTRPATASGNTRVAWEIIEFVGLPGSDNEMIVRDHGTVTYGATSVTTTGSAVSGVTNDTDIVVFITGQLNPDTSTGNFNDGLSTAEWSTGTQEPVFTRGDADSVAAQLSYAVVEFTGDNWNIQRAEHQYSSAGVTETESITALGSLSRTFIHTQKRVGDGLSGLDEYGAEVWLSSIGAVSFELQSGATTPADQYSVVWVIENTQTGSGAMTVQRSNGVLSTGAAVCGGAEPCLEVLPISPSIKTSNASIFGTNRGAGSGTAYPRTIIALSIASSTAYEAWRSDTGQAQTFRTEIIEWPVAVVALRQNYYRFYVDNDALDPTDPWPIGATDLGENTSITSVDDPLAEGETVRLRITAKVTNANLPELTKSLKLQYGKQDTSCSAIVTWTDVGGIGSGEIWRGFNGSPADGTALATSTPAPGTLNISVADVAGTYEEANNSSVNPFSVVIGEDIEYDWVIQHNGALQRTDYCFRMVESDGTVLKAYNNYPSLRTTGYTPVSANWRWYDDATSTTPTNPLAAENATPIDIANENEIKLRVGVHEIENASGANVRFALQFSEYANFSDGGTWVVSTSSCAVNSLWCYSDGAGVDTALIDAYVLSDSDSCVGGIGNGCGQYNEGTTTPSTLTQPAGSNMEFEFTLQQAGARVNAVYFFRLYDLANDDIVIASSSYPSLVIEGSSLEFTTSGLPQGVSTEGIVTDVASNPTSILYGVLPFNTEYEAAYRLSINTNTTEGYQILMLADQTLTNGYGTIVPPIAGSNAIPTTWSAGCSGLASCFGYHVGDDILAGGSSRFAADNSYASVSTTTPEEVAFSSGPANESHDIVYKIQTSEDQAAGDYEASIKFIAIPTF